MRIVKHEVKNQADPAGAFPPIGSGSLHRQLYRCIVIGTDGWIPCVEIVYVDHNHFHMTDANDALQQ